MKVFYKSKEKLVDMDLKETQMFIQKINGDGTEIDHYQNCYVYVSADNHFYIQQNDTEYNWGGKRYLDHSILIDDLTDRDIKIIKVRYGDDAFEKYKC